MSEIRNHNHNSCIDLGPILLSRYPPHIVTLYEEVAAIFESVVPDVVMAPSLLDSDRLMIAGDSDSKMESIASEALQVVPDCNKGAQSPSMEISSPELPIETWAQIFSYLHDEKDMVVLSHVSKTLQGVALDYIRRQLRQRSIDCTCAVYAFINNWEEWNKSRLLREGTACHIWLLEFIRLKQQLQNRDFLSLTNLKQAGSIQALYDSTVPTNQMLAAKIDKMGGGNHKPFWTSIVIKTFPPSSLVASGLLDIVYQNDKGPMTETVGNCIRAVATYLEEYRHLRSQPEPFMAGQASRTWLDAYNNLTVENLDDHYAALLAEYKAGIRCLNIPLEPHTLKVSRALSCLVAADFHNQPLGAYELEMWPTKIWNLFPLNRMTCELIAIAFRACGEHARLNESAPWYRFGEYMIAAGEFEEVRKYRDALPLLTQVIVGNTTLTRENYLELLLKNLVKSKQSVTCGTFIHDLGLAALSRFLQTVSDQEVMVKQLSRFKQKLDVLIYERSNQLRADPAGNNYRNEGDRFRAAYMLVSAASPAPQKSLHLLAIRDKSTEWF